MYFRHYKVDYKFIRLRNTSTSDAAIGGWLVKQTGEGGECEYKLPAKRVVKAGESVTIWSSGSAEAKGGDDLVMGGGKNWLAGSSVITVVIDKEGTETSRRECMKIEQTREVKSEVKASSSFVGNLFSWVKKN